MSPSDERRSALAALALVDVSEVYRVLADERWRYQELRERAPSVVRAGDLDARIEAALTIIENLERRVQELPTYHRTR